MYTISEPVLMGTAHESIMGTKPFVSDDAVPLGPISAELFDE
jgi:hypothetical protein